MSNKEGTPQSDAVKTDLSEAEIAARFQATVRRMANTLPEAKQKAPTAKRAPLKKSPKRPSVDG